MRLDVSTQPDTVPMSARLVEVGLRFGVPLAVPGREIANGLQLDIRPGTITLITGPSGAGKSLLLAAIARQFPLSRCVQNIMFPNDVAVVDAIAPTRPVTEALGILTACGLGEPMLWIRRFSQLSDGEQFRARLARAVSLHRRAQVDDDGTKTSPLLCDEFGAILHRRLAKAIAFNLRKLVTRERLALVVATSQSDLEADLRPDTIVRLNCYTGTGPIVERSNASAADSSSDEKSISFARQLRIQQGTLADYAQFSSMHYRQRGQVGFVDKVFVCREGVDGPLLGVVVYARPTLELRLRNRAMNNRFCKNAELLNRELRLLKRLVIHPDVRGCGLGHWLVRRTLPLAGARFVECLAAMAAINPVFTKAGMRRIGVCEPPAIRDQIVEQLRGLGADPLSADFVAQVCRRPAVRRLVVRCVFKWYQATSVNSEQKMSHQTPRELAQTFRQLAGSEPVYYLWSADDEGWAMIRDGDAAE
ncbi:MAG: ATP-binding cassette domain-containing protein [Phycisphaerae bacterium]|nr:ATP-binding cassette domain-containing protein [Phycisphaerae bacterium]